MSTEACASCGGAWPCPSGHPFSTVQEDTVTEDSQAAPAAETRGGQVLSDAAVIPLPAGAAAKMAGHLREQGADGEPPAEDEA